MLDMIRCCVDSELNRFPESVKFEFSAAGATTRGATQGDSFEDMFDMLGIDGLVRDHRQVG